MRPALLLTPSPACRLYTAIDLESTPESYDRYDSMSALDMFRQFGITKSAYEVRHGCPGSFIWRWLANRHPWTCSCVPPACSPCYPHASAPFSRTMQNFLKPTLLVGLFAPPEELSAGAGPEHG